MLETDLLQSVKKRSKTKVVQASYLNRELPTVYLLMSIAFWNSVTLFLFCFCFLLLCHCVARSCQVNHFLIIVNGMMYRVNQRCLFLSWTGTMNRCYWCILGLHAHAIYSDVISFCTERVLFGNTVYHFRRSWIYYSFSTSKTFLLF